MPTHPYPQPVRPLTGFWGVVERTRFKASKNPGGFQLMTLLTMMSMIALGLVLQSPWALLFVAMAYLAASMWFLPCIPARPLDESDRQIITLILNDYPLWMDTVAQWISQGALDYRHMYSIVQARTQARELGFEPQRHHDPHQAQHIQALVAGHALENHTPAAAHKARARRL